MSASSPGSPSPGRLFAAGTLCLAVALAAAAALALRHLGAAPLPGCGLDSACHRALAGPYGTLPWIGWPLAFLGTSYFAALLSAWCVARPGWPLSLRWIGRCGGLASLGLLGLALQQGTPCPFCITAQLANLAFVLCSERARGPSRARRPQAAFLAVALGTTGLFTLANARVESRREATAERELADSTRAIQDGQGARAFVGRYRRGPERAALRLVLFTDYQCEDCARIEKEAWTLLGERSDLSLSIKHFPLCKDCNRRARELGQSPHPNACWAARAAEAAGLVGGDEGFWRMHRWLFERGGAFVDAELRAALGPLALEPGPFLEALHGAEALARVQADVDEALRLGIQGTPMVFLNGVELRGWRAPLALRRAVETLGASAPEPAGPEADRPPDALEKGLEDWRLEPRVDPALIAGPRPAEGRLEVVLWSDYLDPQTRELDRRIRAFAADHAEVRYTFRHYPLDPECLSGVPATHPGACRAARASEAARALSDASGWERFHAWLMQAQPPLDEARLREGAGVAGLDPDGLLARLSDPSTLARVRADAEAARRLAIHSIPLLFVDAKRVPRWRVEGGELLPLLLTEALAGVR